MIPRHNPNIEESGVLTRPGAPQVTPEPVRKFSELAVGPGNSKVYTRNATQRIKDSSPAVFGDGIVFSIGIPATEVHITSNVHVPDRI